MGERTLQEWRDYYTPLPDDMVETLMEQVSQAACKDVQTIIDLAEKQIKE